jgi:hypothetical protein
LSFLDVNALYTVLWLEAKLSKLKRNAEEYSMYIY